MTSRGLLYYLMIFFRKWILTNFFCLLVEKKNRVVWKLNIFFVILFRIWQTCFLYKVFFFLFVTSWMLKFAEREVLERSTPSQSTRCSWAALDCKRRKKCRQSSVFKLWSFERAAVVFNNHSKLAVGLLLTKNLNDLACFYLAKPRSVKKELEDQSLR